MRWFCSRRHGSSECSVRGTANDFGAGFRVVEYRFTTLGREYESLPELADSCDDPYAVPTSGLGSADVQGPASR